MRASLRRLADIEAELSRQFSPTYFLCHKTTRQTGNGSNLVCAGALAWQDARGIESDYVQICRRLEAAGRKRRR